MTGEDQLAVERASEGMDHIHSALAYLQFSWGIDTPREDMVVNLQARVILLRAQQACYNECANILGMEPFTDEDFRRKR